MRFARLSGCLFALTCAAPLHAAVDPEQCATVRGRAVYRGLGYDHVVEVDNQCPQRVTCTVWTDVDPEPRHDLSVDAGQLGSVVTRRGSPASAFVAQGQCKL